MIAAAAAVASPPQSPRGELRSWRAGMELPRWTEEFTFSAPRPYLRLFVTSVQNTMKSFPLPPSLAPGLSSSLLLALLNRSTPLRTVFESLLRWWECAPISGLRGGHERGDFLGGWRARLWRHQVAWNWHRGRGRASRGRSQGATGSYRKLQGATGS